MTSKLDPGGVLKEAFNDATGKLKTEIEGGATIEIDHVTDSIQTYSAESLVNVAYDRKSFTYDANNYITSIIYKMGVTTVATINITYDVNYNITDLTPA